MAKIIKYQFVAAEVNHGTEERPDIEQILADAQIECKDQTAYDANYPIAEKEAVGEITVEGEFDPEPAPTGGDSAVWDELDAAYQEGVDSV
jgi:hypothetical protein